VRLVYLDESGLSHPAQEPWLVEAGVIVHGDYQLKQLYRELREISERHLPQDKVDEIVLHTSDIYGGNGKHFDKARNPEWADTEKRWAILDDLAQLPKKLNLTVVIGHLERAKYLEHHPNPPRGIDLVTGQHATAYLLCLLETDLWFRQNKPQENCLVIVENNQTSKSLIKASHQYFQDQRVAEKLGERDSRYLPLRHIQEDPAFQDKKPSHPLVLADFIAYVCKRVLMRDPKIGRFYEPLRERLAEKFIDKFKPLENGGP
jgi:hypothetical protein